MGFLPVVLDLSGVCCLVAGGGGVAERRTRALLRAGAVVTVVAPRAGRALRRLAARGTIAWRRRACRLSDLAGTRLVVAATSDRDANAALARAARRRGILVNVADDPAGGRMHFPAVLRRGPLVIAISTSGESPALARALRDELARRVGPAYADLARLVGSIRRLLRHRIRDPEDRRRRRRRLARAPLLPLLLRGRAAGARRAAMRAAGLLGGAGRRRGAR